MNQSINNFLINRYNYKDSKTDYRKTLKVANKSKKNKTFMHKKPLYSFYLGKPQIMNDDKCYVINPKIKGKYYYVPSEFLTIEKK